MAFELPEYVINGFDIEKNKNFYPKITLEYIKKHPGSGQKAWWVCSKGHSYETVINSKMRNAICVVCSGRKVVTGVNDFASQVPEMLQYYQYDVNPDPKTVYYRSVVTKLKFHCPKGDHIYEITPADLYRGRGCYYCSGHKVLAGYNDIATKCPEVLDWWDYDKNDLLPSEITTGSNKKVWFICPLKHSYQSVCSNFYRGRRCPYCGKNALLEGFNDLQTKAPEVTQWWDYDKNTLKPNEVSYGTHQKYWMKCSVGHSYQTSANKFYSGRRCPYCDGKKRNETNNLTTTHPHLAEEWDYAKNSYRPETISRGHDKKVWWICSECSHNWQASVGNRTGNTPAKRPQNCPKCAKGKTSSRGEQEIAVFLQENNIQFKQHHFVTDENGKKYEIDIYVPELKIGIEFNGVYYHSEKFVDRMYHYNKFLVCQNANIQLIQIWEDQWQKNREIVKNMLLHKLGKSTQEKVYARKTTVKEIPYSDASVFFNTYHIQQIVNASAYYGLFQKESLVAAIAVQKDTKSDSLIISRYATSKTVVGGFTKLLKHVEKQYAFKQFVTFSDNCISNGALYKNNGFTADKKLAPDYSYVKSNYREHKFKYRKIKFKNDPNLQYDEKMTERELALLNGLHRIYDAGKIRWIKPKTAVLSV